MLESVGTVAAESRFSTDRTLNATGKSTSEDLERGAPPEKPVAMLIAMECGRDLGFLL